MFFREVRTDVVDNQIDTLGKAFQGLTIACARCHDHKLDPIPTADYYALYGVLTSSRLVMRTADLPEIHTAVKLELREIKPRIRAELARQWIGETETMPRYLLAAHRAWKDLPPEVKDLSELSLDRIQAWLSLLEKPTPEMEDPLYPWVHSAQIDRGIHASEWEKLAARYDEEGRSRAEFNRENFQLFGDFETGRFGAWHADGKVLTEGASPSGEFAVANSGPRAVTGIFPAGVYTHALSERLNGALRSPYVPKDKKFVSIRVLGGNLGARRAILDNCMLSEGYEILDQDSLAWVKIPNRNDQKELPFYVELVTKPDNPRIPDRPDVLNLDQESPATRALYGLQCIRARRLIEAGVRFVEITCPEVHGRNNGTWDQHTELKKGHEGNALITDQGVAALLKDLKARGMFEETLVVWATEFGRTPHTANGHGRDHHETAFTIWMAGGGVKGGILYGATDETGMHSVENITAAHDVHATILHLLGLDHKRLIYRFGGRDVSLTGVHGRVIHEILS